MAARNELAQSLGEVMQESLDILLRVGAVLRLKVVLVVVVDEEDATRLHATDVRVLPLVTSRSTPSGK